MLCSALCSKHFYAFLLPPFLYPPISTLPVILELSNLKVESPQGTKDMPITLWSKDPRNGERYRLEARVWVQVFHRWPGSQRAKEMPG